MVLWLLHSLALLRPDALHWAQTAALGKITLRGRWRQSLPSCLPSLWGPRLIAWLRRRFREPIKSDSPEVRRLHQGKEATPTMGGLFIIAGLIGGALLFADLTNAYVLLALWVAGGLTVIGAVDDLIKLRTPGNGLSPRMKLAGQAVVALVAAAALSRPRRAGRWTETAAAAFRPRHLPGALVHSVGRAGHCCGLERRQPDRWAGRPCRRLPRLGHGGDDAGDLRRGSCPMGCLSEHSAHSRLRRNHRPGRWHDRRPGRIPLVQLPSRPGFHGQHGLRSPWAGCWDSLP